MEQGKSTTILTDLPNEIIFQILTYLPPASVPTLQRVSQRLNELSQPLLWRYYCRTQFKYWSEHHNIQKKFVDDVTKVDWKKVFLERHSVDRTTTTQLNSILSSQTCRIEKAEKIVRYGYDAKDSLVRHLRVEDDAEDVLARRYSELESEDRIIRADDGVQVLQRCRPRVIAQKDGNPRVGEAQGRTFGTS